jgi:hypothetical protein
VCLLFGDANFGQILNQDFRLDLEFPGELVYSDLIRICHQPLSSQFFFACFDTLFLYVFFRAFCSFATLHRVTLRLFAR